MTKAEIDDIIDSLLPAIKREAFDAGFYWAEIGRFVFGEDEPAGMIQDREEGVITYLAEENDSN